MKTKFILSLLFLIGFSVSVTTATASVHLLDSTVVDVVQKQVPTQVVTVNVVTVKNTMDNPLQVFTSNSKETFKTTQLKQGSLNTEVGVKKLDINSYPNRTNEVSINQIGVKKPAINRMLTTTKVFKYYNNLHKIYNRSSWCSINILNCPKSKANQNLYLYQIIRTI